MVKMAKILGAVLATVLWSGIAGAQSAPPVVIPIEVKPARWVVTTLEWPPYVCSHCPENGAGAKALREALRAVNVEVEFVFSTWTKAIAESRKSEIVGYFPAWLEGVRPGFSRSAPLFQSPVGFVEAKSKPLHWKKMADLKGKLIGLSKDYIYTQEFLDAVKDGTIRTESVISDDTNIRKVAAGQLDGAVMDINNALFFLKNSFPELGNKVQVDPKYIKVKTLHLAFSKAQRDKNKLLLEALKKVDTDRIVTQYLETYCPFCDVHFERLPNLKTAQ